MIIGPLLLMLIKTGALPARGVMEMIDTALLSLEKLAQPVEGKSKQHVEQARMRMEKLLQLLQEQTTQ